MKFGIWHDFRNPPRWHRPYEVLYRENLAQISWAEELGYESVWVSEHHVTDDGYLPSVFPMLAAIAQRTTTMRIGSAILLGPFQHPIRFAEDVAVLDQLSSGRVEIGFGLGYREREFELLDVPISERARRTEQLVEVARRVWADGTVTRNEYTPSGALTRTIERDGTVMVECADAVWAQELDLMQKALLERLRSAVGERAPRDLRFRVNCERF